MDKALIRVQPISRLVNESSCYVMDDIYSHFKLIFAPIQEHFVTNRVRLKWKNRLTSLCSPQLDMCIVYIFDDAFVQCYRFVAIFVSLSCRTRHPISCGTVASYQFLIRTHQLLQICIFNQYTYIKSICTCNVLLSPALVRYCVRTDAMRRHTECFTISTRECE